MDNRPIKAKNNESGTITALLTAAEVTTAHVSPVPENAPGLIFMNPGTSEEECIYYKEKDAGLGTISGLTRDIENQNGGVGREAQANAPWETLQSVRYVNNLVDMLIEGYVQETNDVAYVSAASFTVKTNRASFYTIGRIVRFSSGAIGVVSADATYSAGTGLTTVLVEGTVPNPLTTVEMGVQAKGKTLIFDKATGTTVNTGTDDATIVTPKAIADSNVSFTDGTETLTNKTLTSPTINTPVWGSKATGQIVQTLANNTTLNNSSTSYADASGYTASITTSTGTSLLIFINVGAVYNESAGSTTTLTINIDGTDTDPNGAAHVHSPTSYASNSVNLVYLKTGLSAGSHTVKLRWKVSSSTSHIGGGIVGGQVVLIELKGF